MEINRSPKISVIVPVYNVEKYIRRCIESILAQTYTNFEVLLVDDGSTDKSGLICDEFSKVDDRIQVFHKENGGVSSARNYGLNKAKGEWISFIDGDDWIGSFYFEVFQQKITKNSLDLDIVSFDYYLDSYERMSSYKKEVHSCNKKIMIEKLLINEAGGYLWNKIIKLDLFVTNRIIFPENIYIWEDLVVSVNLYLAARHVGYIAEAYYHYNKCNSGSAMSNFSEDKINQQILACDVIEDCLSSFGVYCYYVDAIHIRQLIAKQAYISEKRFFNVEKWREIYPDAIVVLDKFKCPRKTKVQLWLLKNHLPFLAFLLLYI